MTNSCVLEICVESAEHAAAAERGGAGRVELCRNLAAGGVTPDSALLQNARKLVKLPIHSMIRPRAGDFCYSQSDFETMRKEIRAAKQCGADGVVLGILHANHKIDRERSAALVELAYPMPVTFHRAFDKVPKLGEALEDVIQTGAARILTSGGQPQAVQALPDLAQLVQAAQRRISLMLCGGIHPQNILEVVHSTGAWEVHSSVGTSGSGAPVDPWGDGQDGSNLEPNFFERRVAILVSLLRQHEVPGRTTAVAPAHGG